METGYSDSLLIMIIASCTMTIRLTGVLCSPINISRLINMIIKEIYCEVYYDSFSFIQGNVYSKLV